MILPAYMTFSRSSNILKKKNFISFSPSQTKKFGEMLAREIWKNRRKKEGLILGLIGDLGGGKTTFVQGFAKGLGIKEKILSPTFVIIKKYELQKIKRQKERPLGKKVLFRKLYHIDCYRLQNTKEILNLGFKKIISDRQNIIAAEWAEKIYQILPKDSIILKFHIEAEKKRKITFQRKKFQGTPKNFLFPIKVKL